MFNPALRPIVSITVSYMAGIALARMWWQEPLQAGLVLGLLVLAACLLVFYRCLSLFWVALLLIVAAAGGAAFMITLRPAGTVLEFAGSPVYVEGVVVEEPLFYDDHSAYRLRAEVVETREGRFPVTGHLLVKVYGQERGSYWFGERLRLRGTIVEPRGQRNPGGFDYRFYLRSRGIDALVYPKPLQVSSLGAGDVGLIAASAVALRAGLVESIEANLPSPAAQLLTALLFGQRYHLPKEVSKNFQQAGTGHLMAVSGLHVGLVAALILGLWRRLGLRGNIPLLAAILLIMAYAYLTGLSPSALRAAVMLSMALGAVLLDRERDLPTAMAFAALVTLVYNPQLLFAVGFQLSYVATLAVVYLHRPLKALLQRLRCPVFLQSLAAVTLAAQIGVLPLCAYHFQHVSVGALFFNLLILPVMAPLVGFGLAGALLHLLLPAAGSIVLWACRPLLEYMLLVTRFAALPGVYQAVYPPRLATVLILYCLGAAGTALYYHWDRAYPWLKELFIVIPAFIKGKLQHFPYRLGLMMVLIILLIGVVFAPVASPVLSVTFLDVGQGLAVVIEDPSGMVIMYDGGGEQPFQEQTGRIGENILLPYLRSAGIRSLDLLIVSHPHEDHFYGLLPVVETMPVRRMLISPVPGESVYYESLLERAKKAGIPVEKVSAGQRFACRSGLILEVLGPPSGFYQGTSSDLNNNSLVISLQYGSVRFLLTGDVEEAAVQPLLRQGVDLSADVWQVPHHGGFLPSMPDLLERVKPQVSVIPVGTNSFGHPHPETLDSIEAAGSACYRSDYHGAVIVTTDGVGIEVKTVM